MKWLVFKTYDRVVVPGALFTVLPSAAGYQPPTRWPTQWPSPIGGVISADMDAQPNVYYHVLERGCAIKCP